jgi:hypothetical protein
MKANPKHGCGSWHYYWPLLWRDVVVVTREARLQPQLQPYQAQAQVQDPVAEAQRQSIFCQY